MYREEYMFYLCLVSEKNNLLGEEWGPEKQLRLEIHLQDGTTQSELSHEDADILKCSCLYLFISVAYVIFLARKVYSYFDQNFQVQSPLLVMLLTSALICVEHLTRVFVFGLEALTGVYSPHLLLLSQGFQMISLTFVTAYFIMSIKFCLSEGQTTTTACHSNMTLLVLVAVVRLTFMLAELFCYPPEEQYFDILPANKLGVLELLTSWAFLCWFLYFSTPKTDWSRDSIKKTKFVAHIKKAAFLQYGLLPNLSMLIQLLFPVFSHSYTRILFGGGTLAISVWLGLVSSNKEGVFLQYKIDADRGAVSIMEIGDLRKE